MLCYRARGLFAAAIGVATLYGCDNPTQKTDLRSEGNPEVLAVLVATAPDTVGGEDPTFCKADDEKAPILVGLPSNQNKPVCPDPEAEEPGKVELVMNAAPVGWFVRVVFDELLNTDIERLECDEETKVCNGHIDQSLPFTLNCTPPGSTTAAPVVYDGYYAPNGNSISWPLGPSLVVTTEPFPVATGSQCELSIKPDAIVDKQGAAVPSDQLGPFKFGIAPLAFTFTPPAVKAPPMDAPTPDGCGDGTPQKDKGEQCDDGNKTDGDFCSHVCTLEGPIVPAASSITMTFNAPLDFATATDADFTLKKVDGAAAVAFKLGPGADPMGAALPNALKLTPGTTTGASGLAPDTRYDLTLPVGAEILDELQGPFKIATKDKVYPFKTQPLALVATVPVDKATKVAPADPIRINFNAFVNQGTLAAGTEVTLTAGGTDVPIKIASYNAAKETASIAITSEAESLLPETGHVLTIKKGSEVASSIDATKTFKFPEKLPDGMDAKDLEVSFTTDKFAFVKTNPVPNKAKPPTVPANKKVTLVFNTKADPNSLTKDTEITLKEGTTDVNITFTNLEVSKAVIEVNAKLAEGKTYTLTIKKGAKVSTFPFGDKTFEHEFTEDVVLTFTAGAPAP